MSFVEQEGFEQIGRIPIDSGLVMIGDPCYTLPDDGTLRSMLVKNWEKLVAAIHGKATLALGDIIADDNYKSHALIITSTGGDGMYPVYIKKEKGVPVGLFVDFTG